MSKKGTVIGLRNLVYTRLVTDPDEGSATYDVIKSLPGAISAVVNPNASMETLFADDGPYDVGSTIGGISLELNVADLDLPTQADLLGHTMQSGVLIRKGNDIPPFVAVGFKTLKSNGKYRYTWLAKGKFMPSEQNNQTKGDSVSFNTPSITGAFVRRDCDDEWERHIDEDSIDYVPSMGANWFVNPYGAGADLVAPTITASVPANAATGVTTNATIQWTFSKTMALSTIHSDNFIVIQNQTGGVVEGTLTLDETRKIVTFTSKNTFAAGKQYTATVFPSVRDTSGNKMANAHVISFTVA